MRKLAGHSGFVEAVAFSPRGDLLASGGQDGHVYLWELPTGTRREAPVLGSRDKAQVGAVAFSPDGQRLCFGTYEGDVKVHQVARRAPAHAWQDQGRVTCVAFSSTDRLAWCSYDGVMLCGPGVGKPRQPDLDDQGQLFCLAFSPDGATLALGGIAAHVSLWDIQDKAQSRLTHGCDRGCWRLAYSPDGRVLALALADGLQLWDTHSWQMLAEHREHDEVVSGVAYAPDGSRLLTCGWDGTVRLYAVDGRAGQLRHVETYDWGIGKLYDVAVAPDGTLAAAGGDREPCLVIWDVE
jgi:WD40 repeat protein